jgi:hypothetical protein
MKMSAARTLAFVASDPGGANALLPVMDRLAKRSGLRLLAWPYRQAVDLWQKQGFEVAPVDESLDVTRARDLLRNHKVDLLVTGTSLNALQVEKKFVTAARMEGISSLGVLDFYANYLERFSDQRGPFSCLPDRVAVMDEFSRAQMLSLGAARERIVVTGQPAFDRLAKMRRLSRAAARKSARVAPGETLVTFISQPMIEMYGQDPASPRFPGYDQHTVLLEVLAVLETLAARGSKLVLAVRIHPREDAGWFETLRSKNVRIQCQTDDEALNAILASDLVIGMTSTMLFEAISLGCITLSLQPGARQPENLPMILNGEIPAAYQAGEIGPLVSSLLLDDRRRQELQARLLQTAPDSRATRRVIGLIEGILQS